MCFPLFQWAPSHRFLSPLMRTIRLHSLRQWVKRGLVPKRMFSPQETCIKLKLSIQLGGKLIRKRWRKVRLNLRSQFSYPCCFLGLKQ